ncbi:MAG: tetratricopeptide repeat protein [Bacteroidales bacterium]|nr:tetratricopeptide repeat protein [Bacteroidales bacterium]
MKRCILIFYLGLAITLTAFGNTRIDSLKSGLVFASSTDSIDILLKLAFELVADSPDNAFNYAQKAKSLASNLKITEKIAFANKRLGDIKLERNEFYEAKKYFNDALDYYKAFDVPEVLGDIYYNLGIVNYYLGDYSTSLGYYHKALAIFLELKDSQSEANVYQMIGLVHHNMNNSEYALNYYNKSLEINKKENNTTNIAGLIQNIGIITFRNGDYNKALEYYEESLALFTKLDDKEGIGTSLSNIGLIHQNLKHFQKALSNYQKAYKVYHEIGYDLGAIWALHNIGTSYADLENFDQAYKYYMKSLELSKTLKHSESIISNYEALSNLFEDFEDYESALFYHRLYKTINDSIHSASAQEKIAELETLYNLEIKDIELNKKNAELAREKVQKQGLLLGLTFVLIAMMIIFIAYRQKRKAELLLEEHKINLEKLVEQRTNELKIEISERKIAEESDKLKSAFLANMSHELRTPMNAIIAFSNFLKDPELETEKREEYINYITISGENLMQLIDDIIDTAKIEAKQLNISKSETNITGMLTDLYKFFKELIRKSQKSNLEIRLKDENLNEHVFINTDPLRLKQIVTNLLDNAVKYTEEGSIEFGYKEYKNYLEFYVKDSGIGIPKEKYESVFERFSQVEYSLDRKYGGTGLGLAICKNLAELLGGKIWVESEVNKGSTFYFTIPFKKLKKQRLLKKSDELRYASSIQKNEYKWDGKLILVAEDEELNYKVLVSILEKTNAKIVRAIDGYQAVELCKTKPIDLVLMDIQMPNMDGFKATKEIKKIKNLPIIAQTSFAMPGEEDKCKDAGCDDYIAKPLNMDELLYKIDTLIPDKTAKI